SVSEDGRLPSAADMFNGYLGAHVVFALHELGVLSQLAHAPAGLNELTRLGEADRVLLSTLLETATRLGFVERKASGEFALAAEAGDLVQLQGFITWAVGGYGELLRHLAPLARRHSRFG